jgi:hypothetical protein
MAMAGSSRLAAGRPRPPATCRVAHGRCWASTCRLRCSPLPAHGIPDFVATLDQVTRSRHTTWTVCSLCEPGARTGASADRASRVNSDGQT